MTLQIDWSTAPEGTTHYRDCPTYTDAAKWLRHVDSAWYLWDVTEGEPHWHKWYGVFDVPKNQLYKKPDVITTPRPHAEGIKSMALQIDWGRAPEGTTHFTTDPERGTDAEWLRNVGGEWYWWYSGRMKCDTLRGKEGSWAVFRNQQHESLTKFAVIPKPNLVTPRPHAELIKAWADGAEIEIYTPDMGWVVIPHPMWNNSHTYRIKPTEPEKPKRPAPTREQLLKSGEVSKRKYLKRKAECEYAIMLLQDNLNDLNEQYAQKKIRREALLRNT